jgi:hypothetical protein
VDWDDVAVAILSSRPLHDCLRPQMATPASQESPSIEPFDEELAAKPRQTP